MYTFFMWDKRLSSMVSTWCNDGHLVLLERGEKHKWNSGAKRHGAIRSFT
jgi:hypothetical protein